MPLLVSVEGNIGSGKTTFLKRMKKEMSDLVDILLEPVDEWQDIDGVNFLQRFYEDPVKHAVAFQTYVGLTIARRNDLPLAKPVVLAERSIESGMRCFIPLQKENGVICETSEKILIDLMTFLSSRSRRPDVVIYIRCQPETSMARLLHRNREGEQQIKEKYIKRLHELHEDWLVRGEDESTPKVLIFENDVTTVGGNDIAQYEDLAASLRTLISKN